MIETATGKEVARPSLDGTTWDDGVNYVLFENVVANASGRIVLLGDAADAGDYGETYATRLPLNGCQIWQFGSEPPPPFRAWAADPVQRLTPGGERRAAR